MIHLLVVGDGARDEAMIPPIVEGLVGVRLRSEFRRWARLHLGGRGYARKLRYAIRQARAGSFQGLVATVDADRSRDRLQELKQGREDDRVRTGAFPTSVGCAVPHGEAWLLDDGTAVRRVLRLSSDHPVPTVREADSPKSSLENLQRLSPRQGEPVLAVLREMAELLDSARCLHASETGFAGFVDDAHRELGPLA